MRLNEIENKVPASRGFTRGMRPEFELGGWQYFAEYQDEEDVRKIIHYAVSPEGSEERVDFDPYQLMTQETFSAWLKAGKPNRKDLNLTGPLKPMHLE